MLLFNKYKFICFEGVDRTGKTTLAERLRDDLDAIYVGTYPEGYDKDTPNAITDIYTRFQMFWALNLEKSQNVKKAIKNNHIISDRYFLSTVCNHNVLARGSYSTDIHFEEDNRISGILKPDITYLIVANDDTLEQRFKDRPSEHKYEGDVEQMIRVQKEFLNVSKQYDPVKIINTSNESVEESYTTIKDDLKKRFRI